MSNSIYSVEAANARASQLNLDETLIPPGMYCYTNLKSDVKFNAEGLPFFEKDVCPYWAIDPTKEAQENGYCAFMKSGDWETEGGYSLLWDMCKECGINDDIDDADYKES